MDLIIIIDKSQLYYNYANINVKDLISGSNYKFENSLYFLIEERER